jgi:hypothetical protein
VTDTPADRGHIKKSTTERQSMKLFTVTVRVTAERTITLAADSVVEASEAAQELFDSLEEAEYIDKETTLAEAVA